MHSIRNSGAAITCGKPIVEIIEKYDPGHHRRIGTGRSRCFEMDDDLSWTSRTQTGKKGNGGDDETRTRDLCRDSIAVFGFTTTYDDAGTAKIPASRTRYKNCGLGCGLEKLRLSSSHRA